MTLVKTTIKAMISTLLRFSRATSPQNTITLMNQFNDQFPPLVTKETNYGSLKFYCPGKLPIWRADTMLTKEPETIEWIESLGKGEVFWDIGANVGIYSLFAALRGLNVLAFEPSGFNYFLLNRNIEINHLDDLIQSFCVAFTDHIMLDSFNMADTEVGGALHSFADALNWKGESFTPVFKQGMIGFSIDEFIKQFNPQFPNHIKIDVDGIEERIIRGAEKTLKDIRLKTVQIELEEDRPDSTNAVIELLKTAGLKLMTKRHASIFDGGDYAACYNYLFKRS